MSPSRRALVLNATFEPLGIVSSRRAVLLVLDTKAELVHATERVFRCGAGERSRAVGRPAGPLRAGAPSLPGGRQPADGVRPRRVAVPVLRVGGREPRPCDPPQQGGQHTWENVVAACRRCNTRKEDRLPHEAGMVLRSTPVAPRHRVQLLALCGGASEDWDTYLGVAAVTAGAPMTA